MIPRQAANDRRWESNFKALKEYRRKNGDFNVSVREKALYNWTRNQRFRRQHMSEARRRKLNEIGFPWESGMGKVLHEETLEKRWDELFLKLQMHFNRTGSFEVSGKEDGPLSGWIRQQRMLFRRGQIREARIKRLNEIGFPWSTPEISTGKAVLEEKCWEEKFRKLKIHFKRTGSFHVSVKEDKMLCNWIHRQRSCFREGMMKEARMKKLNEIGFPWSIPGKSTAQALHEEKAEERWEEKCRQLQMHFKETGSFHVSAKEDKRLYDWLIKQRILFRRGMMKEARMKKLHVIGFPLSTPVKSSTQALREAKAEELWEEKFRQLQMHFKETGSFHVSAKEDKRLCYWIRTQRQCFRRGMMKEARMKKLNEIGFCLDRGGGSQLHLDTDASAASTPHPVGGYPVGTKVCKEFSSGWFSGRVTSFDKESGFYTVVYEDDDVADYSEEQLRDIVVPEDDFVWF